MGLLPLFASVQRERQHRRENRKKKTRLEKGLWLTNSELCFSSFILEENRHFEQSETE